MADVSPTTNIFYFVLGSAISNNATNHQALLMGLPKLPSRAIHIRPEWRHQAVSQLLLCFGTHFCQAFGFVVGGYDPSSAETELLKISDWTWSTRATYPFAKDVVYYATTMFNDEFYVFGGRSYTSRSTELSTIAKYNPDSDTWLKVGQLRPLLFFWF